MKQRKKRRVPARTPITAQDFATTLARVDSTMGLPRGTTRRDLKLRYGLMSAATVMHVFAIAHVLDLSMRSGDWPHYRATLTHGRRWRRRLRTMGGAFRFMHALRAALDDRLVKRHTTRFCRRVLKGLVGQLVPAPRWQAWMRRQHPRLAGRTPLAAAKDFVGFVEALAVLVADAEADENSRSSAR